MNDYMNMLERKNITDIWKNIFPKKADDSVSDIYASRYQISPRDLNDLEDSYLKYIIDTLANNIAHSYILPKLPDNIWIHDTMLTQSEDLKSNSTVIELRTRISEVKEIPVIYRIVNEIINLPTDVFWCDYCKGHTKNDRRGNCCACGAPRANLIRK